MSEKDLIEALRALIDRHTAAAPDARLMAQEIVRRDAWRLRILAGFSILFWIIGIAGIFVVFYSLRNYLILSSRPQNPALAGVTFYWERMVNHSLEFSMACLVAWMLGSLCTIWLISSARRATLQQIQLSLTALSEQLKELRQATAPSVGSRPGGASGV